jgi:nucleoside-diphosphate-sugar epimerase
VVELCPLQQVSSLVLDIGLTKKVLEWAPETILEDGIRKLVETKFKKHVQK